jgi:predicted Mrr-cat superfamily restriction endonuclease
MTNVWCVRANGGEYTDHFLRGGYVGIGWGEIDRDLSDIEVREDLYPLVRATYPEITSPIVIGNYVGQIARFLLEIKANDYVITPAADTEWLHFGLVAPDPYEFAEATDGCRYRHRRKVSWEERRLRRADFSVPFQNTIRSALSVFWVSHRDEFLAAIGRADLVRKPAAPTYDPYRVVLEQVLSLEAQEFEILVGHLLTALGFEGSEVTGKSGDGGVDAIGELNVANLAKVKVFVQAKRYKRDARSVSQGRSGSPQGDSLRGSGRFHHDRRLSGRGG